MFLLAAVPCASYAVDHIVFTRISPSESRLFVSNMDGSGEHALTGAGSMDYNPAWSPAGDWVAFTSERAGSADLYRIHPDGTGLERLTDDLAYDDQPAFSYDGSHLVFVSTRAAGRANLWILDAATRKAAQLTTGDGGDFRPAWSPDGEWIAFTSDRGSDMPAAKGRWERLQLADIYVVRPNGTGLRRISDHGDFCGSPKWIAGQQECRRVLHGSAKHLGVPHYSDARDARESDLQVRGRHEHTHRGDEWPGLEARTRVDELGPDCVSAGGLSNGYRNIRRWKTRTVRR
jgi:dipeptidyl aminopeptidase/acylaminoacyl peptidase